MNNIMFVVAFYDAEVWKLLGCQPRTVEFGAASMEISNLHVPGPL